MGWVLCAAYGLQPTLVVRGTITFHVEASSRCLEIQICSKIDAAICFIFGLNFVGWFIKSCISIGDLAILHLDVDFAL